MEDNNTKIGQAIIELLGLHVKQNNRVDTSIGDKTAKGLSLTIKRLIQENNS